MDSFGISNIHIEKSNPIFRYETQKKIEALFRLIEMILLLLVVSSFSSHIPATFKISGDYFRSLFGIILSPQIVFLIGNIFVVVLFMKSGFFSSSNMNERIHTDFYHGYVKIGEKNVTFNEQKQSSLDIARVKDIPKKKERKIERSLSEKITKRIDGENTGRQLRRSATENCRKVKCPEEEMNGEEFRQTVEAFIARQQRFLRES
ncbi:uncharacterized protein LOC124930363 [Impatiens glandulifera]|uniref:uncharacterized protein LOC124930363 n=1 Tax=Impatiens glandulifera TaxID=253017 RepID=UPI001FB19779|nr:uncharacterized protein LOC124930363 [Impatiens glandulifera]